MNIKLYFKLQNQQLEIMDNNNLLHRTHVAGRRLPVTLTLDTVVFHRSIQTLTGPDQG